MGAVTKIGLLFRQPYNKPLSTVGQFQAGCYLIFMSGGVLAPVYRDPALLWPYAQTSIPGAGPQSKNSVTSGVASDATGRFTPIYLNPAIEYSYQLFSAAGTLLESGTNVNTSNTLQTLESYKISTTSRSNTAVLTNDPDLQVALGTVGTYRIEADLCWYSSAASGDAINFAVAFSRQLNSAAGNDLIAYGTMNGTNEVFDISFGPALGQFDINNQPSQNVLHIAGTVQINQIGTLSIKWAQFAASNDITSLATGSALYATLL
jgi:hypothetical protein